MKLAAVKSPHSSGIAIVRGYISIYVAFETRINNDLINVMFNRFAKLFCKTQAYFTDLSECKYRHYVIVLPQNFRYYALRAICENKSSSVWFVGHTDYLRGCMADIIYNGAKVIEYARSRKGQSEATAVTWGCSPEFDATRSTEVSFVEDGAFVAIPRPIPRSGSRYIPKVPLSDVMYTPPFIHLSSSHLP